MIVVHTFLSFMASVEVGIDETVCNPSPYIGTGDYDGCLCLVKKRRELLVFGVQEGDIMTLSQGFAILILTMVLAVNNGISPSVIW
jgi:hypothetical protein